MPCHPGQIVSMIKYDGYQHRRPPRSFKTAAGARAFVLCRLETRDVIHRFSLLTFRV